MLNMKKILVTGTVLTAFCTSAFAASADCPPQPSMSERVNAILHENDADRPCPPPAHRMHRQGPKLTPEQRAEHQKLRAEWRSMTPEQREKAIEKMRKDRKEAHENTPKKPWLSSHRLKRPKCSSSLRTIWRSARYATSVCSI